MVGDIISKLVGYDIPYAWQLMHEILVDDQFEFSTDIFIITNPEVRKVVEMALRVTELERARSLRDAIIENREEGKELLRDMLGKISTIFTSVTSIGGEEYFDVDLMHQMLLRGAYTRKQISSLISFVCDSVSNSSENTACSALKWKALLLTRLSKVGDDRESIINATISALVKLGTALKEERVSVMNRNIKVFRQLFRNSKGLEYEREQVRKALASGHLVLDNTYVLIHKAIAAVDIDGITTAGAVHTVLGKFIHDFLLRSCLSNDKSLFPHKVPEILVLDTDRLDRLRSDIRLLACSVTVWNICKAVLPYPVSNGFINEVIGMLSNFSGIEDIDSKLRLRFECVPSTMTRVLSKSLSRDPAGLRALLTTRVLEYVCYDNTKDLNKALLFVKDRVSVIRNRLQPLCNHYESVYAPLFTSIIKEGDRKDE